MTKKSSSTRGKVYFVGAGPGDPELLTLKGKRIIDGADTIIYAGSLVNRELFKDSSSPLHDSSGMHLDEIIDLMVATTASGGSVARVHTGDPSLFGAIKEQMVRLDAFNITYEIVPGVTSAFGAAASLGVELTLPEVTQSVIITRRGGRTPVPDREHLSLLAQHQTTMMIFLSVGMISDVVDDLRNGGLDVDTPVAVVMKATWPDEKKVFGTLGDIADKVSEEGISKTAMICVGSVFGKTALRAESKLYDKDFSHQLRKGGDTI
jgi:precorrin-4/cobalt-precorrin-4 C11-methyltransferase